MHLAEMRQQVLKDHEKNRARIKAQHRGKAKARVRLGWGRCLGRSMANRVAWVLLAQASAAKQWPFPTE